MLKETHEDLQTVFSDVFGSISPNEFFEMEIDEAIEALLDIGLFDTRIVEVIEELLNIELTTDQLKNRIKQIKMRDSLREVI